MSPRPSPPDDGSLSSRLAPRSKRAVRVAVVEWLRKALRRLVPPGSRRRARVERWAVGPLRRRRERLERLLRRLRGRLEPGIADREWHAFREAHRSWRIGSRPGAGRSPEGRAPRLLYVLHEAPGGVGATSRDLMSQVHGPYECFVLSATPHRLRLFRFDGATSAPIEIDSWHPRETWTNTRRRDDERRAFYDEVLNRLQIDLVHVRHLLAHTFDLVDLCAERKVPTILSFHDFYPACPSIHLLDDRGRYCGAQCTPTSGQCLLPISWLDDLPRLKGGYLAGWRHDVEAILEPISAFVTTSRHARDLYRRVYPKLREKEFRVIEHGRDLEQHPSLASPPHPSRGPVRILLPGHLGLHKGSQTIVRLAELDAARQGRLELHFLGTVDPSLRSLGEHHGPYRRDDFASWVAKIRPSFIGLFSIAAETYSHTLSEAWSVGVPVLASDLGALRERLLSHGGGWLVPPGDAEATYQTLWAVVEDPEEYERERRRSRLDGVSTSGEMAERYLDLYAEVRASSGR